MAGPLPAEPRLLHATKGHMLAPDESRVEVKRPARSINSAIANESPTTVGKLSFLGEGLHQVGSAGNKIFEGGQDDVAVRKGHRHGQATCGV